MTRTPEELKRDLRHAHERHAMHYKQWLRHRLSGDDEGMMQASQQIDQINREMDQHNRFVRDDG